MGLNEVKKQIVEDAEHQAKLLMQAAQAEGQHAAMDAEKDVQRHEKELRDNAEKMLAAVERRELAAAEFEGKRALLDKKKELIQHVMEKAMDDLKKLPSEERKTMIGELLGKAQHEIEVTTVYVNRQDKSLVKEKGVTIKEKNITGGLIAETADGKISVDLSFEALLEQIKDEHLQELSEVLFHG